MLNKMLYVKYPARVNPLPDETENSRHSAVLLQIFLQQISRSLLSGNTQAKTRPGDCSFT